MLEREIRIKTQDGVEATHISLLRQTMPSQRRAAPPSGALRVKKTLVPGGASHSRRVGVSR